MLEVRTSFSYSKVIDTNAEQKRQKICTQKTGTTRVSQSYTVLKEICPFFFLVDVNGWSLRSKTYNAELNNFLPQNRLSRVVLRSYLYQMKGMGAVPRCHKEWASKVHKNGGKSSSSSTIKQSTSKTLTAHGISSLQCLPSRLTEQKSSHPMEFRTPGKNDEQTSNDRKKKFKLRTTPEEQK